MFAIEDFLEAAHGFGHGNLLAGAAGEDFGDGEGLAEEALDFAGAGDGGFVLGGKLVQAEDGDDVLQILVALQDALDAAGHVVMFLADDFRGERARGGSQRVHGRENAQFGNGPLQDDGGVQVGEGGGGGRVGQIVGGDIDGLEGGDGAFLGRGDAFLQVAHFGGEGGLVADGAGGAAQQGGHFGTGLGEAEDVVNKKQHVLVLLVAKVLGDGQPGKGHAEARAGRLVHLAIDEGDFGLAQVLLIDDAGLGHFMVEIVAFAGALAHAGKNGIAAVELGDVVDEFHDDDGLADARAAEGADFAALEKGADQVNDFDAGGQDLGRGGLVHQGRSGAVDGIAFLGDDRAAFVHRVAHDVEDAAHDGVADGHGNDGAGVGDFVAALEALGRSHADGAHPVVAEVLLDFEGLPGFALARHVEFDGEGVVDARKVSRKFDIHDGADDLDDLAFVHFMLQCNAAERGMTLWGGAGGVKAGIADCGLRIADCGRDGPARQGSGV